MWTEEKISEYKGKALDAKIAFAKIEPQSILELVEHLESAKKTIEKQNALLHNYARAVGAVLRVANARGLGGEENEEEDRKLYHDLMTADNAFSGVRAWTEP
jgi:hypothetical protein